MCFIRWRQSLLACRAKCAVLFAFEALQGLCRFLCVTRRRKKNPSKTQEPIHCLRFVTQSITLLQLSKVKT